MRTLFAIFIALNALLVVLLMIQFGVFAPRIALHIASDPDNRPLEPLIQEWAESNKADVTISYVGSPQIARELENGTKIDFDAVWPAQSLWLTLGDSQEVLDHAAPIHRSPIVLGLRTSSTIGMGWITRDDITLTEIAEAAGEGKFRLAMPSATDSGIGATAYLGVLHAVAKAPDALTPEHLEDKAVLDGTRALLDGMNRISGEAGGLADSLVASFSGFDGIITSEEQVIAINQRLLADGNEPLFVFYPVEGLSALDNPLAFVRSRDADKEAKFLELQAFLTSDEVQTRLAGLGKRLAATGKVAQDADPTLWNPDWGVDPDHDAMPLAVPDAPVIAEAFRIFHEEMRKPLLTVWVVEVSSAMSGQPIVDLKASFEAFLEPANGAAGPASRDVNIIIPFNDNILEPIVAGDTTPPVVARAMERIRALTAEGGSDMYYAVYEAFEALRPYAEDGSLSDFRSAIVVLAGGPSQTESRASILAYRDQTDFAQAVPINTIAFGGADEIQLRELADISAGQMIRAEGHIARALREAADLN